MSSEFVSQRRTRKSDQEPIAGDKGEEVVEREFVTKTVPMTTTSTSPRSPQLRPVVTRKLLLGLAIGALVLLFFYYALFKTGEKVIDLTEKAASKVAQKGREIKDSFIEKGSDILERGKEKVQEGFESAKDTGSKILEKTKEGVYTAASKAGDIKDTVIEKAEDLGEKAWNKAGDIKDSIMDKAQVTKEATQDVIQKGYDYAQKKAQEFKSEYERTAEIPQYREHCNCLDKTTGQQIKDWAGSKACEACRKLKYDSEEQLRQL